MCSCLRQNLVSRPEISLHSTGAAIAQWKTDRPVIECRVLQSMQEQRENFLPGLILCADSYSDICSATALPQQHVKDPGHSAKSVGGRLQLNTHSYVALDELTLYCMQIVRQDGSSFTWYQQCSNQTAL